MLHVSLDPYCLTIRESVGLTHETQVVEIPVPADAPALLQLRDQASGALFPVQKSLHAHDRGFLLLSLAPNQILSLVATEQHFRDPDAAVSVTADLNTWIVSNGKFEIELSSRNQQFEKIPQLLPGPIRRVREGQGPWRGRTFLDLSAVPVRENASWLEQGPLRSVYRYRIEFGENGFYELELTIDAGLDFVRLHESFQGAAADQIVWDFSGADLPERLNLLDSTASYTPRWLHYHLDQRHARLWCWTQSSQLHDLSDGYALQFTGSDDVIGLVTLEGGKWTGNAMNHLEAWTRRWEASAPATRRLPADVKADSFPGIDSIPVRGRSRNDPHFTLEGWLRRGQRRFALVLSTRTRVAPLIEREGSGDPHDPATALGHFETTPRREMYRRVQGRLRQIHIQHGLMPLQDQLGMSFAWPLEKSFAADDPAVSEEHEHAWQVGRLHRAQPEAGDLDSIRLIDDFLIARVFGFWEGSGAAYSNCVVSRRVGPDMLHFERLAREGKLGPEQLARWRACFSFLAHLYYTDNFYPGPSTMEPVDGANPVEPTMAGMANQNFYTDVITLFGFAGQVFVEHPFAEKWREKFLANWRRQLEYHMYPASGVWEESHTYYQHVLATVLPLFLRRKADGTSDDFADAAFQKLVAGALPQMTPRNALAGGWRHIVPFGDHGADPQTYRYLYRELARAFAPHAPSLAGNLAWVHHEMKGEEVPGIPAVAPKLATGYVEGLGFFFRGTGSAGDETFLALRSGMAWGHHHNDDGSIQFYARGRALIVDSASSEPQERCERKVFAAGHSRAAVQGIEPLNHLWRFNRGWILESRTGHGLDYAVAGTPTFMTIPKNSAPAPLARAIWELRAVIELAPAAYLIADFLDASHRHAVRFQVAHPEMKLEADRVFASFAAEGRLEIVPLFPVAAPSLSLDRPSNPAKRKRLTTSCVEYNGATEPWSLFVVAALDSQDRVGVATEAEATQVTIGGTTATIRSGKDGRLAIASGSSRVDLNAEALLARMRAGSR